MKMNESIAEKEIYDDFIVSNEGGVECIFGEFELKQAEIKGCGRFMDFTNTGIVTSLN